MKDLFSVEIVDPDKDRCVECGCSFNVHLMTCSRFVCPQCAAMRRHAHSDAATPGFFYTECEKHRKKA